MKFNLLESEVKKIIELTYLLSISDSSKKSLRPKKREHITLKRHKATKS